MTTFKPEDKIEEYLAGELGPEDAARVQDYLDADVARRGTVAGLRAAINGEDILLTNTDLSSARTEFLAKLVGLSKSEVDLPEWQTKIVTKETAMATDVSRRASGWMGRVPETFRNDRRNGGVVSGRSLRKWLGYLGAAAVMIAVVALGGSRTVLTTPTSATKIYSTVAGQRATVALDDGSQATLAPATTMHVSGRSISLTGEAVFKVVQDANFPFTVRAGKSTIRVLGTTFSVRAYGSDIRIAVQDGKVESNRIILSANDVAFISQEGIRVSHHANIAALTSWTTGVIEFDNIPLRDVAAELSRWYDADFRIDGSLANEPVTARFTNRSPGEAARSLANAIGGKAIRSGRTITLTRP